MSETDWRLDELVSLILTIKTKESLKTFLRGVLTPKELEEIPMRLQIVKMLKMGIPQQKIAQELGIGIATVTRGSKEIQRGNFEIVQSDDPSVGDEELGSK